jgi:Asp-tRNA(Asn)/Glu-tRNA(Gln) amidotransferase C subunit
MRISDLKKSIREIIVAELNETTIDVPNPNTLTPSQKDTFIKQARTSQKNPSIGTPKDTVDFVEEVSKLEEMAKIAGDLATAIKNVIDDNPELTGLDLKKAIKSDPDVIAALDGESLFDNQLSRFISLSKGERELGQRGRKVDLGNTLAKKMAELEAQEQSLMNKLNKISQLKKELESLDINKVDESQINEMAKIAGDLASAIKSVVNSNSGLEGLALKKAIKADASVKSALAGDELYDNQLNKYIALLKGERELGQRGRKADPNVAAKRSEEEKAKEEKRAEKDAKRAEKERAKAPAQKPTFPTYKKTTTMVDMSGEPSDKDIAKAEKELGIDIPKVKKPSKLSAEEKDKFDIALKGITAKVNRIKNKEAKPTDLELLKKAYSDEGIKKLFKKAGENLDDLVAGIIGGGDTGADLIPDELT